MYIFGIYSLVGSVLSPEEASGDLMYIYKSKHWQKEVHLVSWHTEVEMLCLLRVPEIYMDLGY